MRKLPTLLALGFLFSVTSCALYEKVVNPVFGETATEKTRTYAEYVFVSFETVWIPVLRSYRMELNQCGPGVKAPCWEPEVYKKLYSATDAATACMVASTAPGVDILSVESCFDKITEAKLAFTQEGLAPKGAVQ